MFDTLQEKINQIATVAVSEERKEMLDVLVEYIYNLKSI